MEYFENCLSWKKLFRVSNMSIHKPDSATHFFFSKFGCEVPWGPQFNYVTYAKLVLDPKLLIKSQVIFVLSSILEFEHKGSKLRFVENPTIIMKSMNVYHRALALKHGTLAGLASRPKAQVTMNSELITILALRPFKWVLTYSIWTKGTRVCL
jgi:hypothetical protein